MTSRDPQGTPSVGEGSGQPRADGAEPRGEAPSAASGDAAWEEASARPSAPVLSLEASKAQRQREREEARAARAAVADEDAGPARPRKLKPGEEPRGAVRDPAGADRDAGVEPTPLAAPDGAAGAAAPVAMPRLGGVRPDEGLAAKRSGQAGRKLAPAAPVPVTAGAAPARRRPADPATPVAPQALPLRGPAAAAQPRARHWLVFASFVALVLAPTALTAWYAWTRAAPRFASSAAFSVRTEDSGSALELLGGVAALAGGSSSSDTDVLYEFIRSQEIVELVDARLDLRALWAKGDPERDPIFAYHAPGTIEDLHDHWLRMVSVFNDGSSGLLDIEVQAFAPEDAHAIAQAIEDESTTLINRLSDIAQADATRYAEEELATAVERLKVARAALTRFRNETQMVDPATAVASQMGLLSSLEGQLAQTLIDLDLLRQTAPESDPRIAQAVARVEVIEARMASERAKLGLGPTGRPAAPGEAGAAGDAPEGVAEGGTEGGGAFADLVGQFESLAVDQEFASTAYTAALATYDAALAESRRQSRYLAAHVQPTMAERAEYPARVTLTALTFAFALLAWTILALGGYALRDRR